VLVPTNFTTLQFGVLLSYTLVAVLLSFYALDIWLSIILSLRGKNKDAPPPAIQDWPSVSVHLPLFNEERVAERLLMSCIRLDYPSDKLQIVVVDDSNDKTTSIARSFEIKYPNVVKLIHRRDRSGFKAGALQVALEGSTSELIAIFDADYVPAEDFLRQIVPYLYVDDKIAFVQSRSTYLDGQFSWIAKAMSLEIDIVGRVSQRARFAANLMAHFSGTCGVFRRKAIESVGGWSADTLAEDLDLSIRLYLRGWRYLYVPNVTVPGEIPYSFDALRHQQYRWALGFSQCLRKHAIAILRSREIGIIQKAEALFYLGKHFFFPLYIVSIVLGLLFYAIFPPSFWISGFLTYGLLQAVYLLYLLIASAPIAAAWTVSNERTRQSRLKRLGHLGYACSIEYGLLLSNARAVLEGFLSTKPIFNRTPKGTLPETDREPTREQRLEISD
jgi:cellulose synthase/poly-beta-1,6-N-acetylglucosamine synthase-like glycosyltransferase